MGTRTGAGTSIAVKADSRVPLTKPWAFFLGAIFGAGLVFMLMNRYEMHVEPNDTVVIFDWLTGNVTRDPGMRFNGLRGKEPDQPFR